MKRSIVALILAAFLGLTVAACGSPATVPLPRPSQLTPSPALQARPGNGVWILSLGGTLLSSPDGGATWSRRAAQGQEMLLGRLAFADSLHGWMVSHKVFASTDGGRSWSQQQIPLGGGGLDGIACIDARHVWVVGGRNGKSLVARTDDGGRTWVVQAEQYPFTLRAVAFVDARHGWAVGETSIGEGFILVTRDGGVYWRIQWSDENGGYGAVDFTDRRHGWVLARDSADSVLRTSDGGRTWTALAIRGDFDALTFADARHGWLVGREGRIFVTNDGGGSWREQRSGLPRDPRTYLRAVAASDAQHVWAVGRTPDHDAIVTTSDGGATWTVLHLDTRSILWDVACCSSGARP